MHRWNAKLFENFGYCSETECFYTDDRSYFRIADVVLFNDNFYNPIFDGSNILERSTNYTLFVNVISESYVNMIKKPYSLLLNYPLNYFNLTYTYLTTGDIFWSYGSDRWYFNNLSTSQIYDQVTELNRKISNKNKDVLWIVSNCNALSGRSIVIENLSKYINIEQFGECNNKKLSLTINQKKNFYEKYYFYIASENSDCKDYITEKFYERILFTSIPIVNVREFYTRNDVPPNSFIAFDDFSSPKEMAKYLRYLISNKTEYVKYFSYRNNGWFQKQSIDYRCSTCQKFKDFIKSGKKRIIPDIYKWMDDNNYCLKKNYIPKLWKLL
ncbi:Alpha-(1,3)-fucosyltransferase C [Strongyloides ratti]|uniref:Fucosyltransferase n=1 Tax=Strongyloides ratti TaxID=34506 RepID=A0A090N016_STRRB|nr:Alpha-(1,3)-fucosyltransferase C [Strongyloides ratti]CEF69900.1 Alpha-(1,3)-fucosyltransferase C [Strongyloides ratti]